MLKTEYLWIVVQGDLSYHNFTCHATKHSKGVAFGQYLVSILNKRLTISIFIFTRSSIIFISIYQNTLLVHVWEFRCFISTFIFAAETH